MKMKIRFNADRTVEAQGEVVETYKAGEIYELSASSARRWLRRGLATEVQGSAKKPAAPKSEPKPVEKPAPVIGKRKPPITATAGAEKEQPVTAKSDTESSSK